MANRFYAEIRAGIKYTAFTGGNIKSDIYDCVTCRDDV